MRVAMNQQHGDGKVILSLAAEIQYCVTTYCGAVKTDEVVFDEAIEFVMQRFGHLGVGEIREAFGLAAAGELGDLDMRSYFGAFTVVSLGVILRAYVEYRARIVKELRRREVLMLAAERERNQAVTWNTAAWEADRRETLLGLESLDIEYVTAYDYEWLTRRGDLVCTDQDKRKAWDSARGLVLSDYEALALNNRGFRVALQRVRDGGEDEGFKARQIATAKRWLVLQWIEQEQKCRAELG